MNESEQFCEYVSSRGLLKSCKYKITHHYYNYGHIEYEDWDNMMDSDIVYVPTENMNIYLLYKLPKRAVIVCGDSDITFPNKCFPYEDFYRFINHDKIIHIFIQNNTIVHPKVTHMPIGLDYHTLAVTNTHEWGQMMSPVNQEALIKNIPRSPFWEREILCYSNYHFAIRGEFVNDRIDAFNNVPKELVYYEPTKVNRLISHTNMSNYAFVISPMGNGMDCHRTWEALCLGCIPIVKSSELNPVYGKLPVLIVEKWQDVTIELLNKTIAEYKTRVFDYERLTLSYWTQLIYKKSAEYKSKNGLQ